MKRLQDARVIVFGLGGVVSYAAEGLIRSGVGHLTLVYFNLVCVTNTNRQLHATVSTVGKPKAELMAQRCKAINPEASVTPVPGRGRRAPDAHRRGDNRDGARARRAAGEGRC
jgi:tRNA A37 threonylcarbamoyladenosine dehydratase